MNAIRRKRLGEIKEALSVILDDLQGVLEEEENVRDMMESFQGTARYEASCEACENMECAVASMEEVLEYLEEIISA